MAGDLIAARRAARMYAKYALRKITFTDRLWGKRGATVSSRTQFIYNIRTGVCNPSCALWVGGQAIYPTKQRLRTTMYCVQGNLIRDPQRAEKNTLRLTLPKKQIEHGTFPADSEVVVTVCTQRAINVVATVRKDKNSTYVPIPLNISPMFSYGALVDVVLAQKTGKRVLEFMGRYGHGTAAEINLQYARAYDEYGAYLGEISVQAETRPESWDIIWTGKVDVCFRPANSTELVLLDVVSAEVSRAHLKHGIWKAKAIIRQYYVAAKEWGSDGGCCPTLL